MDPRELLSRFESLNERIIGSISEIVNIESPTFDPVGIKEVADWVERRVRSSIPGAVVERIPAEGRGEHVVIRAFGDKPGKPVLLLGHIDTVHPRGTNAENPTRIENGSLYGCGTFDMKANIALAVEVFEAIGEVGLEVSRPVTILLTCDEEVGSETGRPLVEKEAGEAAYCLIFEPSSAGRVKTGRKGTSWYTIKAHGRAAHAGLDPEKGASAVLELARQIMALADLNDPSTGATVTVGTIKGGTTTNVVPAEAECSVDVRFATLDQGRALHSAIKSIEPNDERVRLEVLGEINRPPLERTDAVVALFKRAQGLAASFDYDLGETQVGGASDGNFVGALGVPVLDGLGITGDGAHRIDEHVLTADIPKRAALLALLLTNDLAD